MIEKANKIEDYRWTARRFNIERPTLPIFRTIVIDFIDPIIQSIRHGEMALAKRWYWSWRGDTNNFNFRLYFLSHQDNFGIIWERIEENRKNKLNGMVKEGFAEDVLEMSEETLEQGIILEYVSEISIMLWRGTPGGTKDQYKQAFHFLSNQLLNRDQDLFGCLYHTIGGIASTK